MNLIALRDSLITAAAGAAVLGGGASIITNRIGLAVANERIERLEDLNSNVKELRVELQRTREDLLITNRRRMSDVPSD